MQRIRFNNYDDEQLCREFRDQKRGDSLQFAAVPHKERAFIQQREFCLPKWRRNVCLEKIIESPRVCENIPEEELSSTICLKRKNCKFAKRLSKAISWWSVWKKLSSLNIDEELISINCVCENIPRTDNVNHQLVEGNNISLIVN